LYFVKGRSTGVMHSTMVTLFSVLLPAQVYRVFDYVVITCFFFN
jgi:hypothetical protein